MQSQISNHELPSGDNLVSEAAFDSTPKNARGRWLIFVAAMFLFIAGAALYWYVELRLIDAARKAVANQLTDPESVQFRELKRYGSKTVCGQFNGKNQMGGYVGFRRFTFKANSGAAEVELEPGPIEGAKLDGAPKKLFEGFWSLCEMGRYS